MSKTTFDVTMARDVVLVCVPDADRRQRITTALREEWPVRTAHDEPETVASLDRDVAVLVVDAAECAVESALDRREQRDCHFETAGLVAADAAVDDRFDARLETPVQMGELRATVERLHRRVRYDRLLGRYYSLAERYATLTDDGDPEELARVEGRLADLRERLDRIADGLDAADAFDAAVGDYDGDDDSFDDL
ncbi:HalX domain-containing protein [Halomicrobium salinisoli]|uniref:HalX domain-containing protein n=1 Tax=Halomicrobium salinisoli TaxID=2878391 RepID=UPI001CF0BF53|nr:HalX domain-containing protein [Halomicrobium salinisoli]